jgi:opacity protein-like surface antigen
MRELVTRRPSMRLRTQLHLAVAVAVLILLPAASSRAGDWYLTPHAGGVFGGDLNDRGPLGQDTERHGSYGLGFGYLSNGLLGFEVDFDWSPHFFGGDDRFVPDNNLTSLMGNVVLNGRVGGRSRLYASAGAGLLQSHVNDTNDFFDVNRNDWGANAGGGLIVGVSERVGVRGDIRYFRNLGDHEPDNEFDLNFGKFSFWKASGGLSIRF